MVELWIGIGGAIAFVILAIIGHAWLQSRRDLAGLRKRRRK